MAEKPCKFQSPELQGKVCSQEYYNQPATCENGCDARVESNQTYVFFFFEDFGRNTGKSSDIHYTEISSVYAILYQDGTRLRIECVTGTTFLLLGRAYRRGQISLRL